MDNYFDTIRHDYYQLQSSGASPEKCLSFLKGNDLPPDLVAEKEALERKISFQNASSNSNNEINYSHQADTLLKNFYLLNREGKEKLIDYSNDLVQSGNYKKTDSLGLAHET